MISEVIKFVNGKVLVFDKNGEQIPELQGRYDDVRVKILARAPKGTRFYHGGIMSGHGTRDGFPVPRKLVSRKEW